MRVVSTRETPVRGCQSGKPQLLARLARIEGQVRGVSRMVEQDRYCIDVITQVSAIHAALDKVSLALLDGHARGCMAHRDDHDTAPAAQVDELMGAVGRLLGR